MRMFRAGCVAIFAFALTAQGWSAESSNPKGRIEGRFMVAGTGKAVAGAKVRVFVEGVPKEAAFFEAMSDADGRYAMDLPIGHCRLWGVATPEGFYCDDPKTYGSILTTVSESRVVRDFVLQSGSPWRIQLHDMPIGVGKLPYFSANNQQFDRFGISSVNVNTINVNTNVDVDGKGVLTLPLAGGEYRFSAGVPSSVTRHEVPVAKLMIDPDFDPRQIQGAPKPESDGKVIRLRDATGRAATVEGVAVTIEGNQATLQFRAKGIPMSDAITLRGTAVDQSGNLVEGVKFTAAFYVERSSAMSDVQATTDANGKFELSEVLLPQAFFGADRRIRMMATKSGFHPAETKELNLNEIKKAGVGDFGTVQLVPGHTLRGKVVDETGRPCPGAVIVNMTNYFLYSHLCCRTDPEGRFVMPDLAFGKQNLSGAFGDRSGQAEIDFNAQTGESVITVRLVPKSGLSAKTLRQQSPKRSVPVFDVGWDLMPPRKEPQYKNEPRYALLVFGAKREERVWFVLDGSTLFVDRNANGDLTEPNERLEPNNPKDDSNRFAGSGSHTHFDVFEFTVQAGAGRDSKFKLHHWIRNESFVPNSDFEKKVYAQRKALQFENSTLWRVDGPGQGQTPLIFMPKPADAQVCALDGPLTFVVRMPEHQVLKRGEGVCDLAFCIAVIGRPHRGAEQPFRNPLSTNEVPEAAHLEVIIDFPGKTTCDPPLRRTFFLKERC